MQSAKRVVKNTGFLYLRMVLTILISLYSTRLILNALGTTDFGIFNLVAGVISLLSFINGAMIIATQRYLSISLGAGDSDKTKAIFSTSVSIHLIIGIVVVVLLELAGFLIFDGPLALNIPAERGATARIIYHFMVISTFFTINAVPYDASINSHEDMIFDALAGIFESLVKLLIAIVITRYAGDKLILYGLLIACLTIFIRIIKGIFCYRRYPECRVNVRKHMDMKLLREMVTFAGWSLYGLFSWVLKSQGLAVMLNVFYGVVVNAAYGIANQVNSNISAFSTIMIKALMPQITKSEGSGDRERMLRLSVLASKMSFMLLAFFAVPIILEMPFVLRIWLKTVPENAVIFCQLILVISMLVQLTIGTMTAVTSIGNIKAFQIATGTIDIFNLPLAFILIKAGLPAYYVFVGSIFMEIVSGGLRTWYAHKIAGLNIKEFLVNTWLFSVISAALALSLALPLRLIMAEGLPRALLVGTVTTVVLLTAGRFLLLNAQENQKVTELASSYISKFKGKKNTQAGTEN